MQMIQYKEISNKDGLIYFSVRPLCIQPASQITFFCKESNNIYGYQIINLILFNIVRMSNQNNLYPQLTNQPLIIHQETPKVANPQISPSNTSPAYIPPSPKYPQGANYPPPPPAYNGYPQNPNYVPANQVFVGNQNFNPNQGYVPNYKGQINQGFIPNNQGFLPNNQGFFPPGSRLGCPICRRETDNFPRKTPGGVTWMWCFCLFIFTGVLCCIPFCMDSCQDTEVVCVICQCVKARQEANCC